MPVGQPSAQLVDLVGKLERGIVNLRRQVAWFQRQIFGKKSEKRLPEPDGVQACWGSVSTPCRARRCQAKK
ncbi:MAG: transposase [Pseudomonadota bacterium]